jgi:hypothetical protein
MMTTMACQVRGVPFDDLTPLVVMLTRKDCIVVEGIPDVTGVTTEHIKNILKRHGGQDVDDGTAELVKTHPPPPPPPPSPPPFSSLSLLPLRRMTTMFFPPVAAAAAREGVDSQPRSSRR